MCYPPESVRALWSRSWRRADERLSQFQTNCALPMPSSGYCQASSGESHCWYYAVAVCSGFRRPLRIEVDDGGFLVAGFGGIAFWMISSGTAGQSCPVLVGRTIAIHRQGRPSPHSRRKRKRRHPGPSCSTFPGAGIVWTGARVLVSVRVESGASPKAKRGPAPAGL